MDERNKSLRGQVLGLTVLLIIAISSFLERRDLASDVGKLETMSLASVLMQATFPTARVTWEEDEAVEGRQDKPMPFRPGRLVVESMESAYTTKGEVDVPGVGRISFEHIAQSRENLDEEAQNRWTSPFWTDECPETKPKLWLYKVGWRDGLKDHEIVLTQGDYRVSNFRECFQTKGGWTAFLGNQFEIATGQPATAIDLEAEAAAIAARFGLAADAPAKTYILLRSRLYGQTVSVPGLGLSLPVSVASIALMLSAVIASIGILGELRRTSSAIKPDTQELASSLGENKNPLSWIIENTALVVTCVLAVFLGPLVFGFAYLLSSEASKISKLALVAVVFAGIVQLTVTLASAFLLPRAVKMTFAAAPDHLRPPKREG